MTERTTNQTPLIQSLGGETATCAAHWTFCNFFISFTHSRSFLKLRKNKYIIFCPPFFYPGCLSCLASCLKTRTWRLLCMTMTYWAEMRKWVRPSSIWRTDSCLVSGPAVACHRLTVCKYAHFVYTVNTYTKEAKDFCFNVFIFMKPNPQSHIFLSVQASISGETSWSPLRSSSVWLRLRASLLHA